MLVVTAQIFQIVGREVGDQQVPARTQHARRLGNGAGGVVGKVQDLVNGHRVERGVGEVELVHVALAQRQIFQARPFQVDARHRQHVVG